MGENEKHATARKVGETVPAERQRSLAPRQGAAPPSSQPGQSEAAAGREDRVRVWQTGEPETLTS